MNVQRFVLRGGLRPGPAQAVLAGCLAVLMAGAVARAGAASASSAAPAGFKIFTSALGGYRMDYPATWHAGGASLVTVFHGPTVQGIPTMVSINPLGTASMFGSVDALATLIRQSYGKKGTTISGVTRTTVAGADARVVTGQNKSLGTSEGVSMVLFLSHGRAWTISYSAPLAVYGKNLGAFHTMLTSFAFVR